MALLYRVIALLLFSLVYIIGLVGNGLLIFIVFRQKNLRTVPNLLVVSLALGDFLFVLFCVPFGAVAYSLDYYPFPTSYCRFENFIINLSLGVSVFSLLALSADRYKIIVMPFSSHANDPSIKLKTIVVSIWLLSSFLAIPETIFSGLVTETFVQSDNRTIELNYCWSPNDSRLLSNHTYMITRQVLRLVIYYLFPLVSVSIFYILIAKHLFQAKSMLFNPNPAAQPFFTQLGNNKRMTEQMTSLKSITNQRSSSNIHMEPTRHLSQPSSQQEAVFDNNTLRKSAPVRSSTFENERLMKTQDSSGSISSFLPSSSSLTHNNNLRRSKDILYETSSITSKNYLAMHTLYQDAKTRKQMRARRKVAKTVLFLCTVFFVCWLPKQIHDLYWFIGVIIYSSRWNHFWQFNKTVALTLSYIYSCINPFALYFLSSTFRHFYKRYLFFWTKSSCCRSRDSNYYFGPSRRTLDGVTFSDCPRRTSVNNGSTLFADLMKIRASNISPNNNTSAKTSPIGASTGNGNLINSNGIH